MIPPAALQPVLAWVRRTEPAALELACAEHPDPSRTGRASDVVRLTGCLSELPLHVPLEMLALGARTVVLRLDGCTGAAATREHLAPLETLAPVLHPRGVRLATTPTGQRRRPVHDAAHMPLPRRALLLLSDDDGAPLPDPLLPSHERLRDALAGLTGRPQASSADLTDLAGPGLDLVATGCEARGVCVRTCPEEALSLITSDGTSTLTLDPSRCTGCGVCVAACDPQALTPVGRHPWSALLGSPGRILARVPTRTCRRCGAPFTTSREETSSELCAVCAFRSATPFGSSVPPEALARLPRPVADRLRGAS